DNLRENLDKLINESKDVADVPICIPLTEKYTTAIVGIDLLTNSFIDGLLLQLMTFHSYEDLKIVFFTNEKKAARWEYLKILPHCWTDDKEMRFFATNPNEMQQVSNYLESIFNARKYKNTSSGLEESNRRYDSFSSYYVIITDDLKSARNIKIIKDVLGQKINGGFSLLIKNDKLSNLPNECSTFIEISEKQSGLFENELLANNVKGFHADFNTTVSMQDCVIKLANVPIELSIDKMMLPKVVTFLEMYDAGKIEQLNIFERWKINNPVISLQVPIGINESGELFKLDLHEKFHGPHGLIAGMTGSGKSELIITYLLSLAVNYHPDEVNFILIDYKGGSVAGAFENKEAGIKIPHMVGTITNLDTVELKRSLVSIESELKRRQRLFNKVREALNESTIDIYKYQRLYREGLVDTPISHLLIVSDEFAELKLQQPEFMSQLISTARIGRSLGVHLILATQKPSGIVDDQIWSNSRFRVCMKVQEKADSMDMIKCSDAAMLKDVGRFYLQVGYNEFFALGHSAWCGSQYIPMDKRKKKVDTAINFIDNTGYVLKHIDSKKKSELVSVHGDELGNVVKYLSTIAKREGINVTQLWLDKIPEYIYVGDLKAKYGYKASPYLINPIIGEFDDPSNQRQGLLTLNITVEGNTVVYGVVGSGKELILSTIIYSIIMEHTAEEVNFYILDFGAETLRNFNNAPQVANILSVNDSEEIDNLFKLLKETIEIRKKLFLDYNGDYRLYCQKSGKKLPTIIVIINYYDSFIEAYQEYEDILLQLTRDGLKCGIIFILTTAGINTIRYRLLQNFKQQLTLQLNDNVDYNTILGNVEGVYPSKHKGRGLIRIEKVYEFQTAYPYNKNNMGEYIKVICQKLRNKLSKQAERIPVLPEVVDEDFIYPHIDNLTNLPIGVEKNSLKVLTYNLQGQYGTLISAQNIDITSKFITSLMKIASQIKDINVIILDAERLISKELLSKVSYYNNNFDSIIDNLYNQVLEQYEAYTSNHYNINYLKSYLHTVCFLVGIDKLKKRLATEISTKFDSLLEKGRDLNKFSFILVEEINRLKVFEYDNWFKILINKYDGIWVGRGITEQFILKLGRTTKDLYEEIGNDFGYAVNNGMPTLVKLLDFKLAEEVIINDPEKIEILDI
ncbi:MAG: type VII secretion protein EssC, partial [Acholeplasmataceae bacterium]